MKPVLPISIAPLGNFLFIFKTTALFYKEPPLQYSSVPLHVHVC